MGSSPLIRAAFPSAARIRWASSASGVATGARSTAQFIIICRWLQLIHKDRPAPLENAPFSTQCKPRHDILYTRGESSRLYSECPNRASAGSTPSSLCMLCLLIHNYSLFFRPVVSPLGGEDAPVVWRCGESPKAALRHPVCIGRLLPAPLSVAQQGQESWTSSPA